MTVSGRVSVITVVRNGLPHLAETLASVAEQDHPDLEHIVVDGASTDGTAEFVAAHARAHPQLRLRLVSEPDRGIYDAMNKGVALASGGHLVFLNADDLFAAPDALSATCRACDAAGAGDAICCCDWIAFSRAGEVAPYHATARLDLRRGMALCHQSTLYPRAVFATVGPYPLDHGLSGDYEHLVRCRAAGVPFRHLPLVLARFAIDGASHAQMARSWGEANRIIRAHFGRAAALRHRLDYMAARGRKAVAWALRRTLGPRVQAAVRQRWLRWRSR